MRRHPLFFCEHFVQKHAVLHLLTAYSIVNYRITTIFAVEPRIVGNAEVRPMNVGERYGNVLGGRGETSPPFFIHNRY